MAAAHGSGPTPPSPDAQEPAEPLDAPEPPLDAPESSPLELPDAPPPATPEPPFAPPEEPEPPALPLLPLAPANPPEPLGTGPPSGLPDDPPSSAAPNGDPLAAPELPDPLPPGVLLPPPHADQSGNASKAQLTSRENIFMAAAPSIATPCGPGVSVLFRTTPGWAALRRWDVTKAPLASPLFVTESLGRRARGRYMHGAARAGRLSRHPPRMFAQRHFTPVRVFLPVAAVGLAGLCRCSVFVDLDSLGKGRMSALVDPSDGASSDGTHGPADPLETGADGPMGLDRIGVDEGGLAADSPGAEDRTLPEASAGVVEGGGPTADGPEDAATDGSASPPDAGVSDGGPSCDPAKPFGAPVLLASFQSTLKDGDFRLLPNELTGFFWSSRAGTDDLYVTTRSNTTSPFGAAVLLNNVSSGVEPSVTADGLNLAFRRGNVGSHLYWATRTDVSKDFSTANLLANVNSTSNEHAPFVGGVPNGTNLYFASDRSGDFDLYHATGRTGVYNAPKPIAELNVAGARDDYPVSSNDDLTLFFASDRPGGSGSGDLWTASRRNNFSAFGAPTNLKQLNTAGYDRPDWLSPDGCRLYITTDVTGNPHVYVATRPM
ncbi:MAG: hypothetical protein M3O36_09000 [Myxococcota bacterium]|nr:hypothetical protein [Myxococcota bacterium]